MPRVQRRCLELVFPDLHLQLPVFPANYVELAYHVVVLHQVLRVQVQSQDLFAGFAPPDCFLELGLPLGLPFVVRTSVIAQILSPKDSSSMQCLFYKMVERYFRLSFPIKPRSTFES